MGVPWAGFSRGRFKLASHQRHANGWETRNQAFELSYSYDSKIKATRCPLRPSKPPTCPRNLSIIIGSDAVQRAHRRGPVSGHSGTWARPWIHGYHPTRGSGTRCREKRPEGQARLG